MWRFDASDMFGMFAGIILGWVFALVAYLVYLFVYKRIQMNHEMRLELIKQAATSLPKPSVRSLKAA